MATDYVVRFTGQDNLSGTINSVKQKLQETGQATSQLDQISQNRTVYSPLKEEAKGFEGTDGLDESRRTNKHFPFQ